jgi:hypothetical protein
MEGQIYTQISSVVTNLEKLIAFLYAEIKFAKRRAKVQSKFNDILKKQNVEDEDLLNAVNEISDIALVELGKYIQYRDSIIKALKKGTKNSSRKEEFFHNVIMPMRTAGGSTQNRHLLSNLWLLDDKFMTYSYAASGTTVSKIISDIETKNIETFKTNNRPDLSIFFNKNNGDKDLVLVELKGAHADKNEKNKAITELPNNINIIRENIPSVNKIWGYIITTIDDNFVVTLKNQDFIRLFTTKEEGELHYKYYSNLSAHIFVLDFNTLISDAFARNKTFLDILENNSDCPDAEKQTDITVST